MEEKKKRVLLPILAVLILILLIVFFVLFKIGVFRSGEVTQPTEQTTTAATEEITEPSEETTEPAVEDTTAPAEETTEATQAETEPTKATTPPATVPPTTAPEPTETQPIPTQPQLTDPATILERARAQLKGLSADAKEVGSISNPKQLTIQVSGTDDVQTAAQAIVDQVKGALAYEQSQANPNVAVGNPNPFTYEYNLTFVQTADGRHTFLLNYRFTSTSYEISNQNYDTNQMVADVCAYLDSLGKVKFDSQTSDYATSQPVIVLLEHPYETALSMVKAQVESASALYGNYDFYYVSLTLTSKGGVQKDALLFYIINK